MGGIAGTTLRHLELYGSADRARELPFESIADGREDELREFVDESDFGRSRLLYVVAVGLGTSDLVTQIERLGVHVDRIVGTATIRNGEEGDSMDMYASTLVRATPDEDARVPDRAVLSVASHNERTGIVEATTGGSD